MKIIVADPHPEPPHACEVHTETGRCQHGALGALSRAIVDLADAIAETNVWFVEDATPIRGGIAAGVL